MKPEFISSATVRVPERLVLKGGSPRTVTLGVRWGLWVHPQHGPVLIDTGYGPEVLSATNRSFPLRVYAALIGAVYVPDNDPVAVLAARGFAPQDVRHILITHFHADHISRLKVFSHARFHVSGEGYAHLKTQRRLRRLRHGVFFELLPDDFQARIIAFEANRALDLPFQLGQGFDVFGDASVMAVPLAGHATGHFGFIWPDYELLYAADATWLRRALIENRPPSGPARWVYEDEVEMGTSLARLRYAADAGCELILCHNPVGSQPG